MDKRIQIWNILHDGQITAISNETGGNLTMFVTIPFLRHRIKPLGDSFVLNIQGVKQIELNDLNGISVPFQEEIEINTIEILYTASNVMPVKISTTAGELTLDFEDIYFNLDTGQEISFELIQKVCGEYWLELKQNAIKNRQENNY